MQCPSCNSTNCHIAETAVAQCRECGCKYPFFWNEVPHLTTVRQWLFDYYKGDKQQIAVKKAQCFTWNENASEIGENRYYCQYYNLAMSLKFPILQPPITTHATQSALTEVPNSGQNTSISDL